LHAFEHLAERFVVMYGDTMVNVDLRRLWDAHPLSAAATLFLHPNDHPQDSDLVEIDDENRLVALHPYPHPAGAYFQNLVNAALYVFEKKALATSAGHGPLDFGKHVLPEMIARGEHIQAYVTREYIKDAGTPQRLERVRKDYASGRIAASSLEYALPAVFFDRDGTLNYERNWLSKPEQLELLPGAAEAVRLINEQGWLAVVITNQPVIARGECSEPGMRLIHNKLEWLLGEQHAYLDGIYYCPHHPEAGFSGERIDLKIDCACRKPGIELVERAVRDLNIDLKRSWFIGDRAGDINTARNARIASALVGTGPLSEEARVSSAPTIESENVLDAVRAILARI
jgi:D,D-heptose 1,7-bisphosphate phosphatase